MRPADACAARRAHACTQAFYGFKSVDQSTSFEEVIVEHVCRQIDSLLSNHVRLFIENLGQPGTPFDGDSVVSDISSGAESVSAASSLSDNPLMSDSDDDRCAPSPLDTPTAVHARLPQAHTLPPRPSCRMCVCVHPQRRRPEPLVPAALAHAVQAEEGPETGRRG